MISINYFTFNSQNRCIRMESSYVYAFCGHKKYTKPNRKPIYFIRSHYVVDLFGFLLSDLCFSLFISYSRGSESLYNSYYYS